MEAVLQAGQEDAVTELQFATFYVGDILLGIDIRNVQEINRQLTVTEVPHSKDYVRGVINLRGDVATVIDLRTILGLPIAERTRDSRNLVVNSNGEAIGFWVDRISDIHTLSSDQISPPPTKVDGVDGSLFKGVFKLEKEMLIILNVEEVLSGETNAP